MLFNKHTALSLQNGNSQTGVHHLTIWPCLRQELECFLYKRQLHQQITDSEKLKRTAFAKWCRNKFKMVKFLKQIVFSDDCKFSCSGIVDKQSRRVWGSEDLLKVYPTLSSFPYYGSIQLVTKQRNCTLFLRKPKRAWKEL